MFYWCMRHKVDIYMVAMADILSSPVSFYLLYVSHSLLWLIVSSVSALIMVARLFLSCSLCSTNLFKCCNRHLFSCSSKPLCSSFFTFHSSVAIIIMTIWLSFLLSATMFNRAPSVSITLYASIQSV